MHHAHASSSGNQRHWRADWSQPALERTWRTVGMLSMAVGVINAFIPLLPTTVFLLIGVWAYGKGDPAMRERLSRLNPAASVHLAQRLLEASQRQFWQPSPETLAALREE